MHSAIFVATMTDDRNKWDSFAAYIDRETKNSKGMARIAENVWLLDLTVSVAALGPLIMCAEDKKIPYSILPFEHAPEWLPAWSGPKPIQARNG